MERSDPELLRHYNKASQKAFDRAKDPYSDAVKALCRPDYVKSKEPSVIDKNVRSTTPVKVKFQNVYTLPHSYMYKNKLPPQPAEPAWPAPSRSAGSCAQLCLVAACIAGTAAPPQ